MIIILFSSFLLSLPLLFFSSFIFSFVCMCRHLYMSFTVTPHALYNHQYYSSISVATIFDLLLVILKLFKLLWKTFDFIGNAIFFFFIILFYFILFYFILYFLFPDLLQGVGKDAIGVLKMIKRRLEAEIKTVGRNDLKLLAKLLQENDLEVSMGNSFHVILWRRILD